MVQPLAGSGFTGSSVNFDFFGEPSGASLGLAVGANPPRGIIFFDVDAMMLKRTDGVGGAAAIGGGSGGPSGLQMEYDTGQSINTDATDIVLAISKSTGTNRDVLSLANTGALGDALDISMGAAAAGRGIVVDHAGSGAGISVTPTTGVGISILSSLLASISPALTITQTSTGVFTTAFILNGTGGATGKTMILEHSGTGAVAGQNVCLRLQGTVQSVGIELDSGASLPVGVGGEGRIRYSPGLGFQQSSEGADYRTMASQVAAADYTLNNTGTASRTIDRTTFTINDLFDFVHAMVVDLAAADVFDALVVT